MKVPGTDDGRDDEEDADPSIESKTDALKHDGLTDGAKERQAVANEVELSNLTKSKPAAQRGGL